MPLPCNPLGGRLTLPASLKRWLEWEQMLNERLDRDSEGQVEILIDHSRLRQAYRPDLQGVWPQQVVWLPREAARGYGPLEAQFAAAFGCAVPAEALPLLIHPQQPAAHQRAAEKFGVGLLPGVFSTPTASGRTVVAQCGRRRAVSLKLSLGAKLSGMGRSLPEKDVASALVISSLLSSISRRTRDEIGLDWFPETSGVVDTASRTGWLLRHFPSRARSIVPAFSLISRRGEKPPLLVDLIAETRMEAEDFVMKHILHPYVRALAFLLFEEGIHVEGHMQNVLFELSGTGALTGRLVLRDLSDMSVDLAHRVVRRKPLPDLTNLKHEQSELRLATVAGDHRCGRMRPDRARGAVTVERYGLRGFVWALNTSMSRFYPDYRSARIERRYLELWEAEANRVLGVRSRFTGARPGVAVDQTIFAYQQREFRKNRKDQQSSPLEPGAESLFPDLDLKAHHGSLTRTSCAWGNLYLLDGIPTHFLPRW